MFLEKSILVTIYLPLILFDYQKRMSIMIFCYTIDFLEDVFVRYLGKMVSFLINSKESSDNNYQIDF